MPLSIETDKFEKAGRPLYIAIADHIEHLIESRELRHNEKLPATLELSKLFGVTIATVQQGLGRLTEKGLLRRSPKLGTFVNNSKSSRRLAIAFGFNPFDMESKFYMLYYAALEKALAQKDMSGISHFGLMGNDLIPSLNRLKTELEEGKYSGILAIAHSREFIAWAENQKLTSCFTQALPDLMDSAYLGMKHLLERGYRRIAFISMCNGYDSWVIEDERAGIAKALAEKGLPSAQDAILNWGERSIDAYQKALAFFKETPKERWPDAILCHHDVLTKGLLSALTELRIRIPQDIALLTHANKGDEFLFNIPLTRLQFDPERLANETVSFIESELRSAKPGVVKPNFKVPMTIVEGDSAPFITAKKQGGRPK